MRRRRSAFLQSARTFRPFTQQLAKSSGSVAVTLVQNLSDCSRHFAEVLHSPSHSLVFFMLVSRSLQAHSFLSHDASHLSLTHPHSCWFDIPR